MVAFTGANTAHAAATAPTLVGSSGYSILGGAAITNTGATSANGAVGVSPGTSIDGGITAGGGLHSHDASAIAAQTDATNAYNSLTQTCDFGPFVGDQDLAGQTLTPGVHCYDSSAQISTGGVLHLDANGETNPVWIFRTGSTLTTITNASVVFDNVGSACNVFWQVGSSATLGKSTHFIGTIIAADDITLVTGASVNGRILARGGTVVLDTNTISGSCAAAPILTLVKKINNNNGGTRPLSDFTLTAAGPITITGVSATGTVTSATVTAGLYTLSETAHSDYTAGLWTCTNGITVTSSQITLSAGQSTVCTITNDDKAPSLILDKIVINDSGGAALESAWTLTADGGSAGTLSGSGAVDHTDVVSGADFKAGTYALSETGPAGYAASSWSCVKNSGVSVDGASVILGLGDTAICTIHNDDIASGSAVLTVTKIVNNNHGGTKTIANFPLFIDGNSVTSGAASTTSAGLHTVSETSDSGYAAVIGDDCVSGGTITLVAGTAKTCTITNSDIAPILHLRKVVVNDNGGTATTTDWTLTATGSLASSTNLSSLAPVDSGATFKADTYILGESGPAGYTASAWSCVGASVTGASIKLGLGDVATCTITNDDIAPVSSGGGGGSSYVTPVPPLIDVVKVPSPLALPAGPGPVTYTYTLRNIGTVPVSNVTMVDDTCSPTTFISGDTNNNAELDVNETWIYRCSTTLLATHTNTVTATGWANGISAVDIASATVVVGASVVPPLIHVTKIPKPLALPAGAGIVTYTEKITNPGTVVLSNVLLTDDKCAPMKYISGDANGDSKLDVNETWIYTCQTNLTKTTTNTAMASGEANSLTARDFAIATVVVGAAIPALPNTGLPPGGNGIPWNVVVLSGIFAISFLFYYYAIRKKRTV